MKTWLCVILVFIATGLQMNFVAASSQPKCYERKLSQKRTFQHQGVSCDLCPPGMYMEKPCTQISTTSCKVCSYNYYIDRYNNCPECWYCSKQCTYKHQYVKKECSPTQKRTCACEAGKQLFGDICLDMTVTECLPGYYFEDNDGVCVPCPEGTYTSEFNVNESCITHTNCTILGMIYKTEGNTTTDASCYVDVAVTPTPSVVTSGNVSHDTNDVLPPSIETGEDLTTTAAAEVPITTEDVNMDSQPNDIKDEFSQTNEGIRNSTHKIKYDTDTVHKLLYIGVSATCIAVVIGIVMSVIYFIRCCRKKKRNKWKAGKPTPSEIRRIQRSQQAIRNSGNSGTGRRTAHITENPLHANGQPGPVYELHQHQHQHQTTVNNFKGKNIQYGNGTNTISEHHHYEQVDQDDSTSIETQKDGTL